MTKARGLALALTAVVGISAGAIAADDKPRGGAAGHSHGTASNHSAGSKELHEHMMKASNGMKSMRMTGDVDRDFVAAMKQHHQDGLEMANIVLEHGTDAKAKAFARRIIDGQRKELAEFDRWLAERGSGKARSTETSR